MNTDILAGRLAQSDSSAMSSQGAEPSAPDLGPAGVIATRARRTIPKKPTIILSSGAGSASARFAPCALGVPIAPAGGAV